MTTCVQVCHLLQPPLGRQIRSHAFFTETMISRMVDCPMDVARANAARVQGSAPAEEAWRVMLNVEGSPKFEYKFV